MGGVSDDDLDDILDSALADFRTENKKATAGASSANETQPTAASNQRAAPTTAPSASTASPAPDGLPFNMEEMLKQLSDPSFLSQMEGLESNPDFSKAMDDFASKFLSDLSVSEPLPTTSASAGSSSSAQAPTGSFQDAVQEAVKKLNASREQTAQASQGENALFDLLQNAGGNQDSLFEGLMMQLVSKDILYEPMKELNDKYPAWLKENESNLPKEDFDRYSRQYSITSEIVTVYEAGDQTDVKKVLELMLMMQETGNPPPEILKMLTDTDLGVDGLPKIPGLDGTNPENCRIM